MEKGVYPGQKGQGRNTGERHGEISDQQLQKAIFASYYISLCHQRAARPHTRKDNGLFALSLKNKLSS